MIVCVGIFDGVHVGHRRVIDEAIRWSREAKLPACVVTFDRVPPELAVGKGPSRLLMSVEHRLQLLGQCAFDVAVLLRFTHALVAMEAEAFVREILHEALHARGVVVGFDQRFGKGRRGDFDTLRSLGEDYGFEVRRAEPASVTGRVVSSTAIRDAVQAGRLDDASAMLGRPVTCRGTAAANRRMTARLAHPTVHVDLHHEIRPPAGVYAVRVSAGADAVPALCNISRRQCGEHSEFSENDECAVDVCFQDPTADVGAKEINIEFIKHLRNERPFTDDHEMRQQITADFGQPQAEDRRRPGESPPTDSTPLPSPDS